MQKYLLIVILIILFNKNNSAQNYLTENVKDEIKLGLLTDLKFTKSASSSIEDGTSGSGNLGIRFTQGLWYGSVTFTALNPANVTKDSSSSNLQFANNLLVPDKSGNGINSFYASLGRYSFSSYDSLYDKLPFGSLKKIGFLVTYQSNNTTWIKDTVVSKVVIQTWQILGTYRMIHTEMISDGKRVDLTFFMGINLRSLGGNFGFDRNKEIRKYFLGVDDVGFAGFEAGIKLELGNLYGKFSYTNFRAKQDIDDFTGNQVLISLGINVSLDLAKSTMK